jgi:putative tryptophan/tyrosine transport system substrate-binding protein
MRRREFIALLFTSLVPMAGGRAWADKVFRIGILTSASRSNAPTWATFVHALGDLGYVEGQNLQFESRSAEGQFERLPGMAAELASMNVDVIVVLGPGPIQAAKAATSKIPIVMIAGSSDPIGEGLITSFAHPGGNIRGLTYAASSERFGKQLQILKEVMGQVSRIGVLWDLQLEYFQRAWAPALGEAARQLGIEIAGPFVVENENALPRAFAAMVQEGVGGVLISAGSTSYNSRSLVADLARRNGLPTIAAFREFPQAGVLMSYGPDILDLYRRAAGYVHRILKGDKASELPVEQPTKYQLVINLKTAMALQLVVPPSLLIRADEVIE